ncbi:MULTISPECIES: hypothetical protein [unclassified Frankia]|uniref:hypothetical protein n=1 Tax=unclassified Frankia TaxID=2632575 RepID=UPI001EE43784|nr:MULTISPECIES: hypothetical protein [unclassified Frankia]
MGLVLGRTRTFCRRFAPVAVLAMAACSSASTESAPGARIAPVVARPLSAVTKAW